MPARELVIGDCVRRKDGSCSPMLVDGLLPLWRGLRVRCLILDSHGGVELKDFDAEQFEHIGPNAPAPQTAAPP